MKKITLVVGTLLLSSVGLAMDMYSTNGEFNAPTIYGRTNYTTAQDGAIVLDTSNNTYYGKISGANPSSASGWSALSQGSNPAGSIFRAVVSCQASSSITSQNGTWISSIGNVSSGACAITVASGTFAAAPTCIISNGANNAPTASGVMSIIATSTTAISIVARDSSGAVPAASFTANIICVGN